MSSDTRSKFLKARLYSAYRPATFHSVHVLCESSDPQGRRFPCVESLMNGDHIQPYIHDVSVMVMHQPDGRRDRCVTSVFRVFYKRHVNLPHNARLDVQGDVAIMRVASKNRQSVVNMRASDRELYDFIAVM
ncbi:hypothetical protein B0H10DRAFT_2227214 [Mycena sp. CBHHK59/15]|nr:hypothetical protein B0H10DRAFT_2227214 [Mycena sp. CBHHK59/15]